MKVPRTCPDEHMDKPTVRKPRCQSSHIYKLTRVVMKFVELYMHCNTPYIANCLSIIMWAVKYTYFQTGCYHKASLQKKTERRKIKKNEKIDIHVNVTKIGKPFRNFSYRSGIPNPFKQLY